jgi:hypothetical protein
MKKMSILRPVLAVLLILTVGLSSASALDPSGNCAEKMYRKLKESIKYPRSAVRNALEGEVLVIFTVSAQGKVTVYTVSATNTELATYINEQLSSITCTELIEAHDKFFKVKFKFHLL